jgi:predicted metal-dependent hydrolase
MEYSVEIIKSRRKTLGLEIRTPGALIVRAPYSTTKEEISQFVAKHEKWIQSHMEKLQRQQEAMAANSPCEKFTEAEIREMLNRALEVIPPKVCAYAKEMGVTYGRITIRNQRTRWGSCSAKGNLNFNCLLTLVPEEVMNYVIVHELCHLIEMNHSPAFWTQVEKVMPDYGVHKKWLKDNGGVLINRL